MFNSIYIYLFIIFFVIITRIQYIKNYNNDNELLLEKKKWIRYRVIYIYSNTILLRIIARKKVYQTDLKKKKNRLKINFPLLKRVRVFRSLFTVGGGERVKIRIKLIVENKFIPVWFIGGKKKKRLTRTQKKKNHSRCVRRYLPRWK